MMFTSAGPLSIKQAQHKDDGRPPDEACDCATCRSFSRAYLRHLFLQKEMLAAMALTTHNLHYYAQWMAQIRRAICIGNFGEFVKKSPGSGVDSNFAGG